MRDIRVSVGANLGLPCSTVTGITVRHSAGKVQTGEGTGSAREATTTRTGTPASVEPQIELALSPFHVWWLVWMVTLTCPATMLPRRGSGPLIRQHIQLRVWRTLDAHGLRRGTKKREKKPPVGWWLVSRESTFSANRLGLAFGFCRGPIPLLIHVILCQERQFTKHMAKIRE